MSLRYIIVIALICLCADQGHAESGSQIPYPEKSRVIIRENEAEVTTGNLTVTNPGSRPWLMQAWLEDENGAREGQVYPELSRLEANFSRRLLIAPPLSRWHEGREGLNWLVIRLIPSTAPDSNNTLTIPVVLRLKVFLRSRTVGAEQEKPVLSCNIRQGGMLMLHNRGRHYVTLTEMKDGSGRGAEDMPLMLAPGAEQTGGYGMTSGPYKYGYVNDRGVIVYERVMCH
ncbi:fimbria/pilus periplasmic chaperone [Escherichia albertii]|uniref:fimbrial biogenesis chaperone n=1 Tax=Escherichia albertii TaxID=208962 RepID=UPI001A0725E0|nr:fimbria/pilus periplasmic chaperone [Escherichia albertii]MCZ9098828.1 fimbria/pilus periplasmic chaperone [Escherichia albertii]MCZ9103537.1 fimbria/pilus periplasmic chaperone [Escherichia albertii]MCZ9126780.1 fimbria/pilus periplasmic chaperone [Escherichia albertii]WDC09037.1 fimbria/pilus periplasmic chaperone [Escherichia albertii]